jgi:hypothetical protein
MKIELKINGEIIKAKRMFNILYTLLCVCVLCLIFVMFALATAELMDREVINHFIGSTLFFPTMIIIFFIGYRLFDSKHYK